LVGFDEIGRAGLVVVLLLLDLAGFLVFDLVVLATADGLGADLEPEDEGCRAGLV